MIGITERGDAALDTSWLPWVREGKPAILISKDPHKLCTILEKEQGPLNVIVHATITGFGGSILEPNVPDLATSRIGFNNLQNLLGHQRVVLRVDPVIPTKKGISLASDIIRFGAGYRVRISFIDMYSHVRERFRDAGILDRISWSELHAPLSLREEALGTLQKLTSVPIEVCGEPDMKCTGCVSEKDLKTFGVPASTFSLKGQRKACSCLAVKQELLSTKEPCAHNCLYCYWRSSK